jgi:hypothetical protein
VLSALFDFCRSEAVPRLSQIVISTEVGIAAVLAALFAWIGAGAGVATANTGDVVLTLLAYGAIAFGFAVAGLTLVLTAPDRGFASELAWSDPGRDPGIANTPPQQSSYGNLLFIFSWTAITHWLVVVGAFSILIALGKDSHLLADGSSTRHRIGVGVLVFFTVYAVELFLITVITLTQVGDAYIGRLHRTKPDRDSQSVTPPAT